MPLSKLLKAQLDQWASTLPNMRSKSYRDQKAKVPADAIDLTQASALVKELAHAKFDEAVELHVHLGVTPSKSDEMVRGSTVLPAGAAKQKKVAVFAVGQAEQKAAKEAGATLVGGEELIAIVAEKGSLAADIAIATPDIMPKLAKVARILGPVGLMPNPKTGTVTKDPATAVRELSAGKLSFKMDQLGNIHEAIGRISWDAQRVTDNAMALLEAIKAARPATLKGQLIRTIALKSTMGPAIRVTHK